MAHVSVSVSHIIFDLDGTLLDTLEDLARAGNHVCAQHGWPTYPIDTYRYKVGNGMVKLAERLIPAEYAGDGRVLQQVLNEFRAYYDEHKEDHTRPYPGIESALDRLQEAGIHLAVLTNKDHAAAAPLVARMFGPHRFDVVQGHIAGYDPKPAAPITQLVLEQLGADPANALYVGDSNVDVETGHNAGLPVAGVSWGFRGRDELAAAGADFIADTPDELVTIVLGQL